jgi:hypothetical protein
MWNDTRRLMEYGFAQYAASSPDALATAAPASDESAGG